MSELSKNYEPALVEERWYKQWMDKGYFNSVPDERKSYTVVIPPPNVTGVLHMGHTLNETVQDILVRKARMSGFNACWVPGSDHASIATEAKVVDMLKQKGINKSDLSREEFLKHAFEWKDKYGGIIYNQIEKLGCSVDWNRVSFTMDPDYYKAVIKVFVDLYKKGSIYRGARMINWDPVAKTALSDEEVEYREVTGKLYYIRYKGDGQDVVIATQRPETIMGDVAVCANPQDERYKHLAGRFVEIPLINKSIPVIFDDYVDPEFGTGILKITPAHDINDYNIGLKHNLPVVDTLNEDGTLSAAAQIYVGEERFAARKKIVAELKEKGLLVKEEEYQTRMGYSQRTNAVAEPKISTQWFVKMKDLAGPALSAVVDGEVNVHPGERFLATYKYWLENVKDWCISRQLWWGQQIPAWYDREGRLYVGETIEEAFAEGTGHKAQGTRKVQGTRKEEETSSEPVTIGELTQDEDVLDTWFSSWLWPIEVFKGITKPDNEEIRYYYPTSVLVTGQDIIFFWVARMIMAGMEYMKEKPFDDVYFTGMVRDKLGRKMSKSLGNSPDLLELIDKYGADAVRFGIMISSPAGNDLLFDESSLEQGKFFNNKLWNALKLMKLWESVEIKAQAHGSKVQGTGYEVQGRSRVQETRVEGAEAVRNFAVEWFENRLNAVKMEVDALMKDFRLSEGLKTIYSLIWDDFCSWYLEWIKPAFNEDGTSEAIDPIVYEKTISFFEDLVQLLHPYMPFITEEIYHLLRDQNDDLVVRQFKTPGIVDTSVLAQGEKVKQIITAVRDVRNKNQLKMKDQITVHIQSGERKSYSHIINILERQLNASIGFTDVAVDNSIAIVVGQDKYFIETGKTIDTGLQKDQLLKDLQYHKGFLVSVEKKLGNEKFVSNARPEVIELERKKQADAEAKIRAIEESLKGITE